MLRFAFVFAALTAILAGQALAGDRLIQIEPRPTYGATVTLEAGVRVFRPLPGGRRTVIVNPNRTPLVLDMGDGRHAGAVSSSSSVSADNGY